MARQIQIGTLLLAISTLWTGCYSFKNASVPPDLQYYFVENFNTSTPNAPPTINTDFQERLKNKIRNESRLNLDQQQAQIIFGGSIVEYRAVALAPEPGETVGLNRLNIGVRIVYTDVEHPDKNWEETFREYAEYGSDVLLADVEQELISTIFDQVTENIFNKSFGDW